MILASKSPRRKEILENFGIKAIIKTEEIEEISSKENIYENIMDIVFKKCDATAQKNKDEFVVGSDTVVLIDGKVLGKPKNEDDAYEMLSLISGKKHEVVSAYSILNVNKNFKILNYDKTIVQMRCISNREKKWYIKTKEPMDKAGSYGIQGQGAVFVEGIEGDYFNVMGFPISKFVSDLKKYGFSIEEILKL